MQKCKVYKDGSHYIAIRPTTGYTGIRRKPPPEEPIVVEEPTEGLDEPKEATVAVEQPLQVEQITGQEEQNENAAPMSEEKPKIKRRVSTRADEFLRLYRESIGMKREQQYKYIASGLAPYFVSKEALYKYLERKMENKRRAEVTRRIRCLRRASLHELSYFATFTYDDKKATEAEFEKRLLMTLSNLASRKGWKYMGAWERGGDTDRLHFHAILYIPEDKMMGKLEVKRDYNVKTHRMEERIENSFFQDRFGRNKFELIDGTALTLGTAVSYVLKYIEKTGGRIICSRGMRTFIETDIDNDDIVARLHEDDDKKYVLFDDFKVYRDGKELGEISPGVLSHAKTVN